MCTARSLVSSLRFSCNKEKVELLHYSRGQLKITHDLLASALHRRGYMIVLYEEGAALSNVYTMQDERQLENQGRSDKITCTVIFNDVMQSWSTAFLHRLVL